MIRKFYIYYDQPDKRQVFDSQSQAVKAAQEAGLQKISFRDTQDNTILDEGDIWINALTLLNLKL